MELKLPNYSYQDRLKMTKEIKEGDYLYKISCVPFFKNEFNIKKVKVLRVTPSGEIRLDDNSLLKYLSEEYYIPTEELKKNINEYEALELPF